MGFLAGAKRSWRNLHENSPYYVVSKNIKIICKISIIFSHVSTFYQFDQNLIKSKNQKMTQFQIYISKEQNKLGSFPLILRQKVILYYKKIHDVIIIQFFAVSINS